MNARPKCDFCSQRPVRWSYPARPVHLAALVLGDDKAKIIGWNSNDPWAACTTCHALIERGDRVGLLERSVQMFPHRTPMTDAQLRMTIKQAHDGFFGAVTGDPTPYVEET